MAKKSPQSKEPEKNWELIVKILTQQRDQAVCREQNQQAEATYHAETAKALQIRITELESKLPKPAKA